MRRYRRLVAGIAALFVVCGLCTACRGGGRVSCEDEIWPGPRIGPTCRALCKEPELEEPCP